MRGARRLPLRRERDAQRFGDLACDLVLDFKGVLHLAVIALGPERSMDVVPTLHRSRHSPGRQRMAAIEDRAGVRRGERVQSARKARTGSIAAARSAGMKPAIAAAETSTAMAMAMSGTLTVVIS